MDKEEERFSILRPGDYAVMVFEGEQVPLDLDIVFVARSLPSDDALCKAIERFIPPIGRQSMKALTAIDIQALAEEGNLHANHFLRTLVIDDDLIEAAQGMDSAAQRFMTRVGRKVRIDKETLLKARAQGDAIGELGESLVDIYLDGRLQTKQLKSFVWLARVNAISPMDFEATSSSGDTESVEVKTTSGDFERPFHVSLSELREAVTGKRVYRIYRVYDASSEGAQMRISNDFKSLAQSILTAFQQLPEGVVPDSVTVAPKLLSFGKVIRLNPGE